ncbi:MAG TPA: hypothetical protein VKB38_13855 [Terracidiphilus sp.]|nr:hypothetical protein [Terracidiphilus sp.]
MIRKSLAVLLLLLPAVPSLAKSDPDYYPLSCDVMWTAVKSTLNNPNDYGVLAIDDLTQRASFVVVGDLAVFKDVVALRSHNQGCSIKLTITQIGSDNSNERGFRGRLKRTLAKMRKPAPPLVVSGNSTASAPAPPAASAAPAPGASSGKPQSMPTTGIGSVWQSTLVSRLGFTSTIVSGTDQPQPPAKRAGGIPVVVDGSGSM